MNEHAEFLKFSDRRITLTFESSRFVTFTRSCIFLPFEYTVLPSAKCTKLRISDDLCRSDI